MVSGVSFLSMLAEAATQPATQPSFVLWLLKQMFMSNSAAFTALTVLAVAAVGASGLAFGSIRIRGFALGIPGVMFTGLIVGKLLGPTMLGKGLPDPLLNTLTIGFLRDFGLILFVYAVGIQVGPGFFASLRAQGIRWNILAMTIVLLGAALSVGIAFMFRDSIGINGAVGLFAGGTTNAPSFASATEVIKQLDPAAGSQTVRALTAPAFAISYPFGLLGVILAMVLVRAIFRASPTQEAELALQLEHPSKAPVPAVMNIELTNPNLNGVTIQRLTDLQGQGIVISRVLQNGKMAAARSDTVVRTGDVVLAVGAQPELEAFRLIAGTPSTTDLRTVPSNVSVRDILVTHREVLGKTVEEVNLADRIGVAITRVRRGTMEFTALGHLELKFGDRVLAVGEPSALDQAAKELGNSPRDLNHPRLTPIFLGLMLGVILGAIPLVIPGLPVPLKLGLAAGPMIVAIILARIGQIGSLIWYMPNSASQLMREFGITLFLICVGILAGDGFFNNLNEKGLLMLGLGAAITIVPLMLVGIFARLVYKTNYLHICGILAGSMTSPSLAFTQTMSPSEAPALSFATVYPLTMILRVMLGQLLVLVFASA